ncbi:isoprenyl transferase [Tepidibacter formicigenes]|jgi:undecaprenyl diphosphate synthase|uniref:Isoprenyl transferase n=1 Tax=Tepidibacter formicigenes DSM 15518 TaxID=1123349 RepID=A0A1M6JBW7_9FIRM|nr:isoprenyl transferase [Tepidibacter formicigenes]SHJ44163.1 undecaprenyl diphosphate synthase [Tepidibacter formicigenes DSM 15518]
MNKREIENIDKNNIPNHIAIIMDGNGRWAKKRFLPRTFGHKAGVETIREIVKECSSLGVKYLTLYAFSTENWKRPKDEVNALMNLLVEYLRKEVKELHKNNVILNTIGDVFCLPKIAQEELKKAKELTKNNDGLVLTLALNYGSRNDIKNAIINILKEYDKGNVCIEDIDEDFIKNYLSTRDIPDPDILIRPSGEYRVSNFLLWEIAYSEFWFSEIYWPDFKKENLHKVILDYQNRERRFGGLK